MFPLSLSGSVRLELGVAPTEDTVSAALHRIADMLNKEAGGKATAPVVIEGNAVRLRLPWLRMASRLTVLVAFNAGRITVDRGNSSLLIRYDFSTVAMLLMVTAMVVAVSVLWGWYKSIPLPTIMFPVFANLWPLLFVGNYIVAMARVPLWLQQGLEKDPRLKGR